jgi:AcrR family transcriptional regulator
VSTHLSQVADGRPGTPALTARQRRILEAAVEVFAERGFEGATTAAIAQRAGVAEGTLFKRYRTKRDLLLAVLGPYLLEIGATGLRPILESALDDDSLGLQDFLLAVVRDRVRFARSQPAIIRILVQEAPFHPEVLAGVAGLGSTAIRVVERFQRRGEIDPALPPATIVRMVFCTLAGLLLGDVFVLLPSPDDPRALEDTVQVLARGLAPQGEREAGR